MFATRTHLLIGMPKCGCIYTTRVLAASFGDNRLSAGTQHAPLGMIPTDEYNGLTIIGMIRNPFAWYYSKWAYFYYNAPLDKRYEFDIYFCRHQKNQQGPLVHRVKDYPPCDMLGMFSYMHIAYHCYHAEQWLGDIVSVDDVITKYDETFAPHKIMRTEQLTDDIISIFGSSVNAHLEQFRNSIKHKPYQEAYTAAMRRQVEDTDGWFLERYKYSME